MKIVKLEFEGTPEEFSKVSAIFGAHRGGESPDGSPQGTVGAKAQSPEANLILTQEIVEKAFTRRSLSPNQRQALQALLRAGQSGLSTSEISKHLGITRAQLAGVFGALGRRVARTEGWPPGAALYSWEWDDQKAQWIYRLQEPVREALQSGKVRL